MHSRYTLLAAAIALTLPGAVSAARFSWFDESPARDSLGQVRVPIGESDNRLSFGVHAYKSLAPGVAGDEDAGSYLTDATTLRLYGEVAPRTGELNIPLAALHPTSDSEGLAFGSSSNRLSGFGIKLQHRVDPTNTVALTAGYSEASMLQQSLAPIDVLDTRAALSWTSTWAGGLQPGMTGSVFVGDESARDETYQRLGRRYYGFSVGGELRLMQDHTPYFSYRLRRNFYNPDDPTYLMTPYDDRSQIAAGWKWQVQSNWSLQAEARYGLNGAQLDPYAPERSRIFFGTRFDFR